MRHAAAAIVLSLVSASALAQDKEPESQQEIAERIVAEQQGLKISEVEQAVGAPARALAPIEGGPVEAPGGSGGAAADAAADSGAAAGGDAAHAAAPANKAKQSGGIPWGLVVGAMVSLGAAVLFVRAWRRAADPS